MPGEQLYDLIVTDAPDARVREAYLGRMASRSA